jgi:hypothetical protein
VQWSFLQYKKLGKSAAPTKCFLHSATQIGSKFLIYGGCDYNGVAQGQLLLYDTATFQWASPSDATTFQEDHPGARYGHSAVLVELHPPKIMVYGGMLDGGTYEFEEPDGISELDGGQGGMGGNGAMSRMERLSMSWRKKGKQAVCEETDENVYFLTLNAEHWVWGKPLVNADGKGTKPAPRTEHSACKTGSNEVTVFGGWVQQPCNELYTFNFVDMEWKEAASSGIQPRPRYTHTHTHHTYTHTHTHTHARAHTHAHTHTELNHIQYIIYPISYILYPISPPFIRLSAKAHPHIPTSPFHLSVVCISYVICHASIGTGTRRKS